MKLTDVDLRGYGRFTEDPASFRIERFNLPLPWDYVYTNGQVLLRTTHDGRGYLQIDPPGGPALYRPERGQSAPDLLVWIIPQGKGSTGAFTNFWRPTVPLVDPHVEPDAFRCNYSPEAASWRVEREGLAVDTQLFVPPDDAALGLTVTVSNVEKRARTCVVMPALKPHLAPFSLAPWDNPALYQTAAACTVAGVPTVWMETRDPGGNPARRLRAAALCDLKADSFEVSLDHFIGRGTWDAPEAVWQGGPDRAASAFKKMTYGKVTTANAVVGRPPMVAFAKTVTLKPGKLLAFTFVLGKLPETTDGKLPARRQITKLARYLREPARSRALRKLRASRKKWFALRTIATPDEAFNRYVNEWLPLQLDWVTMLDRGWPTGMRGTRDASQDTTGIVPLDAAAARARLCEILALQRSDGWFLRQYSTAGRNGLHDPRDYVDAGCWVWEFLRQYLCYTRDFALLDEELDWLDDEVPSPVLDHAMRIFDYYLDKHNLGEHGLCKIREGDWNDSVNRAGIAGRGESVMVSCQLVLALEEAAELVEFLERTKGAKGEGSLAKRYRAAAKRMRENLRKHALNAEGYLNGVFNDAGKWIFSPRDPDGRHRVNGPVNSFAVIAGVGHGAQRISVLEALDTLKGPHGWRLFHPGICDPPIDHLGRVGSGDKVAGLSENGTVYNHGAQGFLGRALWTAGRGRWFYDVLRSMFPYPQDLHPVDVQKTAPYGVVNHWKETAWQDGQGGDTFLSGSITTAIRNVYRGMVGWRPALDEVIVDPVIPGAWKSIEARDRFLDAPVRIVVNNPSARECGVARLTLDGLDMPTRDDDRLERRVGAIPVDAIKPGKKHVVEVTLG